MPLSVVGIIQYPAFIFIILINISYLIFFIILLLILFIDLNTQKYCIFAEIFQPVKEVILDYLSSFHGRFESTCKDRHIFLAEKFVLAIYLFFLEAV